MTWFYFEVKRFVKGFVWLAEINISPSSCSLPEDLTTLTSFWAGKSYFIIDY